MRRLRISWIMALLLSGCAVGTEYATPKTDLRQRWDALASPVIPVQVNDTGPAKSGWQDFADPTLVVLIHKGMASNTDIRIAEARVAETQADKRNAYADFFPQIDGSATAAHGELGTRQERQINSQRIGATGTWEIDPFGGNQRRYEAAQAAAQTAEAALEDTRLTLLTNIAANYVQLRSLEKQEALTHKNLEIERDTLDITQRRFEAGVSASLEIARAEARVQSTAARLPQIEAGKAAVIHRLSVLTASEPPVIRGMTAGAAPIPSLFKEVVVAMPVEAMANRPDIRAAERRLAEAAALSNAAFADFFPKLTLEGFFGAAHNDNGSSSPWSAAINGLVPLLNFGRIASQVDAANARQAQALFGYKKTVLEALEQTEVALANYLHETDRHALLVTAAEQQSKAATLIRQQYEAGVVSQLDLLVAEEDQLNADTDAVLSETAIAQNLVQLYHALGQHWVEPPSLEQVGGTL